VRVKAARGRTPIARTCEAAWRFDALSRRACRRVAGMAQWRVIARCDLAMKRLLMLLALAALLDCAVAVNPAPAAPESTAIALKSVIGSGHVIDDERPVSSFVTLRMAGPIDVRLKAAGRERVIVRADDNIAPLIQTRIVAGERPTLEIDMQRVSTMRPSRTPIVIVEFRTLEDVSMRGSGDLQANKIHSERFALSMIGSGDVRIDSLRVTQFAAALSGSGDLTVAGSADQQAYRLTGSGDVAASRLTGRRVIVSIAGSGDAAVNASEALEATIHGTGDVTYIGSPHVIERRAGTGRLLRKH
jgi:hypothetical protein